jgi:uncharacterized protein (TIGR03435 family)
MGHSLRFAALLVASGLAAQQPAPKFEFVSIREVPRNAPPTLRDANFSAIRLGGQYIDSRTGLLFMVMFAYDVRNSWKLEGLPKWAEGTSYSVSAKPAGGFPFLPPSENREQVRLMLRAMLADRFHLQIHSESRQKPGLKLEVDKGGFKFKEVDAPVPPATEGPVGLAMGDSGGRMIGRKSTVAGIAASLSTLLHLPVIDETGLKGYYDFDVKWASLEAAPDSLGAAGNALVISALKDQFGLRVTSATGPVEYWIIDHVEPPTEN